MKNIIIFRTDRLGDYLIHSRPIYEIKKKYHDVRIIIICSNINKKILENLDYIDEIIVYDENASLFEKIKIFLKICKKRYYSAFILDGKNFSYICNMFINAKNKFGLSYIYKKKIFNISLTIFKPGKIYNFLFFRKISYFVARKYQNNSESLCKKYLDLFNFFNLNITIKDNYVFNSIESAKKNYKNIVDKLNIKNYLLIHFDEKWLDILINNVDLINVIRNLQQKTNKKIILTGFNNNFDYYNSLKNSFVSYDCSKRITETNDHSIFVLDNLDIFTFERFIKNAKINISCHSGFIVQVCGANNGQVLDIINENDVKWYKCWVPSMIFYRIVLKSSIKEGARSLKLIFDDIYRIAQKL